MLKINKTTISLSFLNNDYINYKNKSVILETSIPYKESSSISHVDMSTYGKTSDFLMVFGAIPGKTYEEIIEMSGNYTGGMIGPKLKSILETIG